MTEKDTHLIKPQDLAKRAERTARVQEIPEIVVDTPPTRESTKFTNTAGKVKIDFETLGRFDIPKTLHFGDYSGE